MKKRNTYSLKLIDELYSHVPAFTDLFDEETWYTFVLCFVAGTLVLSHTPLSFALLGTGRPAVTVAGCSLVFYRRYDVVGVCARTHSIQCASPHWNVDGQK
ncbi:hypothetical protein LSTR_LSTR001682 [Laodelphax striatellus]|uniref:Uncharacterized protein n=1 Tax=Laodelphax striatellus TaxID=195883 RepID=A0A482XDN0_LAOST|nr:hypothetical protein LSTR_LSTR001682 [Laodelphax striatellus]